MIVGGLVWSWKKRNTEGSQAIGFGIHRTAQAGDGIPLMNVMMWWWLVKVGDLVRVVQGATRLHPPYLGHIGIIIGPYHNEQAPFQTWFRVQVEHQELKMHESYLALISESK